MSTSFSLADFIPEYPEQHDEGFQWAITAKKEFNELEADPQETPPKAGEYYRHQKIVHRLIRQYDRLMIVHETGTGKTCSFVGAAEFFRLSGKYRKAYVLEKSKTTKKDFEYQLINNCTSKQFRTSKDVRKWYEIKTYEGFIDHDIGNLPDDELIQKFSDCVFFVDEAHNIRNWDKKKTKFDEESVKKFEKLIRFFRMIKRCKIIVSTATPMINTADEIIGLINLISDENVDVSTINWKKDDLLQLEESFRGKVSVVRTLDTGININYVGETFEEGDNSITVVPLPSIEGSPLDVVQNMYMYSGEDFLKIKISSSIFAFPISGTPKESVKSYKYFFNETSVPGKDVIYSFNNTQLIPFEGRMITIQEYLSDFRRLKTLSVKFAFILKNELRYAYERGRLSESDVERLRQRGIDFDEVDFDYELIGGGDGNFFSYSGDYTRDGGAIILGMIFQLYGFEVFNDTRKKILDSNKNPVISKKLRIGIFVETYTTNTENMLRIMNCAANRDGSYLQGIIGSRIARDGINLANVTRGYLISPQYHFSAMYQAMSRFIRATSHEELKKYSNSRVEVNVFQLCGFNSDLTESGDRDVYFLAEEKERYIRKVMRFLKIVSVDCMLNYKRNVHPHEKDGSKECDYQTCEYRCFDATNQPGGFADGQGPTIDEYDFSTYDIYYSGEVVRKVDDFVIQMVKKYGSATIDQVIDEIYRNQQEKENFFIDKTYPIRNIRRYVYEAISNRISSKKPFSDIYGYKAYLQTDEVNIFVQREFPRMDSSSYKGIGYYNLQLIGQQRLSVDKMIIERTKGDDEELLERLKEIRDPTGVGGERFFNLLFSVPETTRVSMMEKVISLYYNGERNDAINTLMQYYSLYIYELKEPVEGLKEVEYQLNIRKQGGPPQSLKMKKVTDDIPLDQTGEDVIVHVIAQPAERSDYKRTIRFRETQTGDIMRILIPSQSDKWRDLTAFEYKLYPKIVEREYFDRISVQTRDGLYGIVYNDSKNNDVFAIAYREKKVDARDEERGGKCANKPYQKIIRYLLMEKYPIPRGIRVDLSDEEVKSILRNNNIEFEDDNFTEAYKWYLYFDGGMRGIKSHIDEMCGRLRTKFAEENRIVYFNNV